MRICFFLAVLAMAFLLNCAPAAAESVVLNGGCLTLGATHMLDDNTGVALCSLQNANPAANAACTNTAGGCIWKAMSVAVPLCSGSGKALQFDGTKFICSDAEAPPGTLCGAANVDMSSMGASGEVNTPCKGRSVFDALNWTFYCPPGYALGVIGGITRVTFTTLFEGGAAGGYSSKDVVYSCIKQ